MRDLDLTNYDVKGAPYDVKEALAEIIFHPANAINGPELMQRARLADRITSCQDDFILLEEAEHDMIVKSCSNIHGFGQGDVILLSRIYNAPQVDVTKKGGKG